MMQKLVWIAANSRRSVPTITDSLCAVPWIHSRKMVVKTTAGPSNADSQKYNHFPFWAHLMFIFQKLNLNRKKLQQNSLLTFHLLGFCLRFAGFARFLSHNLPTAMPMLYLLSQVPFPEILTLECLGLFWSLLQFAEGFGSSSFSNTFPNCLSAHFVIQGHDRG